MFEILTLFKCPDCGNPLIKKFNELKCAVCGRAYKFFYDICFNLVPLNKIQIKAYTNLEKRNIIWYSKLFDEPFIWREQVKPWGLIVSKNYAIKLEKHWHMVKKLIPENIGIFCDISAGSGRFAFNVIRNFKPKISLLCDLSVDSAVYFTRKIIAESIKNTFVARIDYLQPPFKEEIVDALICTDTLIYGTEHELRALKSIYKIIKRGGIAILDFSNIYHRGFWHRPYTYGYSKIQMQKMLRDVGFNIKSCISLYNELSKDLDEDSTFSKIFKKLIPPTRYIFKVSKE